MNANGDERIDHDEFIKFMLTMLMGSVKQKMMVAFRCYDCDNDECISEEEVELVLSHIPIYINGRYGDSDVPLSERKNTLTTVEYMN